MLDSYADGQRIPVSNNMGWDIITDPMALMFMGMNYQSSDSPWSTTYRHEAPQPGLRSSMGDLFPQGGGPTSFRMSGGIGGMPTSSSSSVAGGPLSSIPQSTSTAALGTSLPSSGYTAGSISINSSAPSWLSTAGKVAKTGISAYAAMENAKQNQQAAQYASQPRTASQTPYMANMINMFLPYILSEALNIYGQRQSKIGGQAAPSNALQAMLAQLMQR